VNLVDTVHFVAYYLAQRAGPTSGRFKGDRGLTTTEIAVLTFLLVGGALVVAAIIYQAAKTNAENIPVPEAPA
jgi:hypothetical protein